MSEEQKKQLPNLKLENLPPEESDLQLRIEAFDSALRNILGKYELALGAQARIAQNGTIVADPVLLSARKKVAPTPPGPKVEGGLANPED